MLGFTPSGPPVPEDAFYTIAGTVFHDNNGNGIQDGLEQGVGNVAIVSIFTSTGTFVARAATLSDGSYSFRVARGNYTVLVESTNFATGQPLAGYYSTTGGNSQSAVAPAGGARENFGYRLSPVAVDDAYTVHKNTTLNQLAPGIETNDENVDNPSASLAAILVSGPTHGSVSVNPDGSFSYTPMTGYTGTDKYTYKVNDGAADSNVATVTLTIINDPPQAVNDAYTTDENVALVINAPGILVNDTDPNNDTLTVLSATSTAHGTLVWNANGSFTYTPNTGYVGPDSFTYNVTDGALTSLSATVTITVVGHPPVAVNDFATTTSGTPVTIAVLTNDSDPDHDTITITSSTSPSHGSVTLNPNGTFTYQPVDGYAGLDTCNQRGGMPVCSTECHRAGPPDAGDA